MSYFPLGTRRTGVMCHQSRPGRYPNGFKKIKYYIYTFIILLLSLLNGFLLIGFIHFMDNQFTTA